MRFYRFYFLAPLFVALLFFLAALGEARFRWVAFTAVLFALGINFFPAFQFHYLAPIAGLFVLMSVIGLERLAVRSPVAAHAIVALCVAQFAFWYAAHVFDDASKGVRVYETWDGLNHGNPERRIAVHRELAEIPGKLLVFVRYAPGHVFQDEWVYNEADIDHARIVWARDLGDAEDAKLRAYYSDRQVFLLEPDQRPPELTRWDAPSVP